MSNLGLMLAWSAIQVTMILSAAAALHAIASRRSPASGAWVASVGLGLAVVVGLLSLGPRSRKTRPAEAPAVRQVSLTSADAVAPSERAIRPADTTADDRPPLLLERLRAAWESLDRTAAEPAARCRPWGSGLAVACLTGAGAGLLHLFAGLWALHLLRRRSRSLDEPDLDRVLTGLRAELGCRRQVEIRETAELTAPATAGWRRPVILLPEDWRSWDLDECRAVLAHELAHVCRDDYLTGIVARAATALYFYHPLVHWLAARLRLEQELAADALGARFAGGKSRYLRCLSRLALRQDGRLPCWPARAFLPAKGTLIRRIAMLREETKVIDQPGSRTWRALAASLLLAVAAGAWTLHGPACAEDPDGSGTAGSRDAVGKKTGAVPNANEPFDLSYVIDDDSQGVVAFRPAAAFRRSGMGGYRIMLNMLIAQQWAKAAKTLKFDANQSGQKPPKVELFEQVTGGLRLYRTKGPKPNGRMAITMLTVRTTEPVDWVALGRLFRIKITESRDGNRVYYRVKHTPLAPETFFYCPDSRTLVFTGEDFPAEAEQRLLKHLRRPTPPDAPVFAQGKDWNRFLHGLGLVALDNRGGRLAKPLRGDDLEKGEFDPATLVEGTDSWVLGLDDDDQIVFRGVGTCPDGAASEAIARMLGGLLDGARKQLEKPDAGAKPQSTATEKAARMGRAFWKNLRVEREGRSVLVLSTGLGTLADLAALVSANAINF